MNLVDQKFYTGVREESISYKNYSLELALASAGVDIEDIDWDKGFDIRNVLKRPIKSKQQSRSLSCVGQAWSYYAAVLNEIETGLIDEVSAKAIYSQIFLPNGGAYISYAAKLLIDWGSLYEKQLPSHKEDGSVTEEFMRDKQWKTPEIDKIAKVLQAKQYRTINAKEDMDVYAQAIMRNMGIVSGFYGQNGVGWGNSERPKPPTKIDWAHCVYYGAFGRDRYGRYLATPNSWGLWFADRDWRPGDPPGFGWQKVYADYFVHGNHFNPWTLTDKPNLIFDDMLQLIKGDKDNKVYEIGKDGLLRHIVNPGAFSEGMAAGHHGDWSTVKVKKQEEVDQMPKGRPIASLYDIN